MTSKLVPGPNSPQSQTESSTPQAPRGSADLPGEAAPSGQQVLRIVPDLAPVPDDQAKKASQRRHPSMGGTPRQAVNFLVDSALLDPGVLTTDTVAAPERKPDKLTPDRKLSKRTVADGKAGLPVARAALRRHLAPVEDTTEVE